MVNKLRSAFTSSLASVSATQALAGIKISFIAGSYTAFFSMAPILMPLSGAFGGVMGSVFALCLRYCVIAMICKTVPLKFLAYHIPGFFASLYLARSHWFTRAGVPLLCMALFVLHPQGGAAWLYTLYWIIPVGVYITNKQEMFYNALGATLTAHAVGSVIWLYITSMAAPLWLGLIPIVAVERLLFACGITVMYHAVSYMRNSVRISESIKQVA